MAGKSGRRGSQLYSLLLIMESHPYPGKGLSLPQLVFALGAELTSMAYSSP